MMGTSSITELLSDANTIAVVGLNNDPGTPSYDVASYIQSQGYDLIPVNPNITSSLGHKAVASLGDVNQSVDIVNVFTNQVPLDSLGSVAASLGAKAIWLQPGVAQTGAPEAIAGIPVIHNKCLMREHRRLLADAQI